MHKMENIIVIYDKPIIKNDKIIIFGAGKFREEKLILNKDQATLLLIDLCKFLEIK